jgi:dipeptide/tripeptide permease
MSQPSIFRQFPRSFWVANGMEIFERMGWYGFFAVSSLYLTGSPEDGMLGLTSEDRGVIQGLSTFFLYLFPAVFGALADRYGYKAMFLASCLVMAPAYLLLGLPSTFWGFFAVYVLVAVGHGMFKPVVISTVAKTTDAKTGTLGFGIFYMMVNIGGFLGPIIAGVVRGWDWKYVFFASAGWIVLLGLTCLALYKEPPRDVEKEKGRSLGDVFDGMIEVIGNGRFFLLIVGLLVMLVMGSKWWSFGRVALVAGIWLSVNFVYDWLLRAQHRGTDSPWPLQPMRVGETRYLIFLLLMAGFWTAFNQIFMTLPEYIRDYADTSDLIQSLTPLATRITDLAQSWGFDTSEWGRAVLEKGQVKPEHIINLNAFGIILGQVLISYLARNLKPFTTIISGVMITVVSFLMYLAGVSGWIIVAAVLVFSVGEMLASPKSKEYAGRIAPPDKVGMYMGYFYWCVALGNLFGGLLSGVMYQHFGPKGIDRPDIMWLSFAVMGGVTALALGVYNHWIQRARSETGTA